MLDIVYRNTAYAPLCLGGQGSGGGFPLYGIESQNRGSSGLERISRIFPMRINALAANLRREDGPQALGRLGIFGAGNSAKCTAPAGDPAALTTHRTLPFSARGEPPGEVISRGRA